MRLVQFSVDTSQVENKEEVKNVMIFSTKRSQSQWYKRLKRAYPRWRSSLLSSTTPVHCFKIVHICFEAFADVVCI
jgi:hypothetical protein